MLAFLKLFVSVLQTEVGVTIIIHILAEKVELAAALLRGAGLEGVTRMEVTARVLHLGEGRDQVLT